MADVTMKKSSGGRSMATQGHTGTNNEDSWKLYCHSNMNACT